MNITIKSLLILATLALFAGCGSSGASSPTSPAQIPTAIENYEVEFGAGEVIVTGVLPSGGISSISKSIGKVDATTVTVYGTNIAGTAVSATINTDDNRFYLKLPAGEAYSMVFADGLTTAPFEDSGTGLHSMPLMFLDGATAAGTAEVDADGALVSGDVSYLDIGTVSYDLLNSDISVGKTVASGTNPLTATRLGYECPIEGTANNDAGMSRFGNLDVDGNGINDKSEGWNYFFGLQYVAASSENLDSLVAGYADPTKVNNRTYYYSFRGRQNMTSDVVRSGDTWNMQAPADITRDGVTYAAGDNITAVDGATYANVLPILTDEWPFEETLPSQPAEGIYKFIKSGGGTYTFNNVQTQALSRTTIGDNVPFVIPKLVIDGANVTGIDWKWMWKENGTWVDMDLCELESAVAATNTIDYHHFTADLGSGNYVYGGDVLSITGRSTFPTAISLSSANTLGITYTDVQGYARQTVWKNFE